MSERCPGYNAYGMDGWWCDDIYHVCHDTFHSQPPAEKALAEASKQYAALRLGLRTIEALINNFEIWLADFDAALAHCAPSPAANHTHFGEPCRASEDCPEGGGE